MNYIYKITNTLNNKVYIGQSNNPDRRWSFHKNRCKKLNPVQYIHRAMIKYGIENFSFQLIAASWSDKQKDVDELERELIHQHDSRNPNKGYNLAPGGSEAWNKKIFTEEQEQQIIKLYTIDQLNQTEIGKMMNCCKAIILNVLKKHNIPRIKMKNLSKERMSKTKTGKLLTEEHKAKLKGRIPWMKGKHHSKEAKEKNRQAHIKHGKYITKDL